MAASCISPLHPAAGILHATTGITHRHLTNTSHTSHRHLTQQGPAPVASSAAARGIQRQPVAAAPAHWSSAALLSRRLPEAGPAPQSSQWCWAPRRSRLLLLQRTGRRCLPWRCPSCCRHGIASALGSMEMLMCVATSLQRMALHSLTAAAAAWHQQSSSSACIQVWYAGIVRHSWAAPEVAVGKHAPLESKALAIVHVQVALCAALAVQCHHQGVGVILVSNQLRQMNVRETEPCAVQDLSGPKAAKAALPRFAVSGANQGAQSQCRRQAIGPCKEMLQGPADQDHCLKTALPAWRQSCAWAAP